MATLTPGFSSYGGFPNATVAGASRTTIQTPFSNQVTAGLDSRKARLDKHRLNRTIQTTATVAVVNATVAVATDAINTVRATDRAPATLVNGKRTGRVRRLATNAINALGSLVGGTGYTNGSYTSIPLVPNVAGASGTGAAADITVAGGVVTVCTLVSGAGARAGENYTAGQLLTAAPGFIGSGTGFTIAVSTVFSQG